MKVFDHVLKQCIYAIYALKEVVPIWTYVVATLNYLNLPLRHIFCTILHQGYFLFFDKNKYMTLGMRLLELEQSFDTKNYSASGWALRNENVIDNLYTNQALKNNVCIGAMMITTKVAIDPLHW